MGFPKALLTYEGETFLDRIVGIFSGFCSEVIVVLGYEPERIRAGVSRTPRFVINDRYELGQLTSLQRGIKEVTHPVDNILFTPVDYPAFLPATLAALVEPQGYAFVVPQYQGRHGHPVLFSGGLSFDFLRLPETAAARDVVHQYRDETFYVDVEDPGIIHDVDDPAAYADLLKLAESR